MSIAILYVLAVVFSSAQSAATKLSGEKGGNPFAFNAVKTTSALVFMLIFSLFSVSFHLPTLLYGFGYGAMLIISMYAGYRALVLGPMALTSMIVSYSVVLPLVYGAVFNKEPIGTLKIIGFLFLAVSLFLVSKSKSTGKTTDSTQKLSAKWVVFIILTFVPNGVCSILQNIHQTKFPGQYCNEFMLYAMLLTALAYLVFCIAKLGIKSIFTLSAKGFAAFSGAANAASGLCSTMISGAEAASVVFPAITAGTIISTAICGLILFKEKLNKFSISAIVFGIAAIVLIKL